MTRINLVPPTELMDQHLIAEYREIRLLTESLRRSFRSKRKLTKDRVPKEFTLCAGHILFFSDKGKYIENRYQQLQQEMRNRGFTPTFPTIDVSVWPDGWFNDWQPQHHDLEIVRQRIQQKIAMKPHWYRYYGRKNCGR